MQNHILKLWENYKEMTLKISFELNNNSINYLKFYANYLIKQTRKKKFKNKKYLSLSL